MAQDALFQTEQGIDPRESRDAAWNYLEQLRDPRRGAGLDEEPICGGRAELAFNGRRLSFSRGLTTAPFALVTFVTFFCNPTAKNRQFSEISRKHRIGRRARVDEVLKGSESSGNFRQKHQKAGVKQALYR